MGERCGAQAAAMADAVARRCFGEEEKETWELWDFSDFQVVANTCTGDLRHVHGPAAPSPDFGGPFGLHYFQGRAVLIARKGDGHNKIIRDISELQTMHFEMRCGAKPHVQEEFVRCSHPEATGTTCARAGPVHRESCGDQMPAALVRWD